MTTVVSKRHRQERKVTDAQAKALVTTGKWKYKDDDAKKKHEDSPHTSESI